MKLRFISEALGGQAITLTAAENGVVAGPLTAGNWGGTEVSTAGNIRILTDRTTLQVAPESVRFTVDLSNALFDSTETYSAVTGQTHTNAYDPRQHDLIFLWDMGDDTQWTAPVNILPKWKSKRYAKGPFVSHCYTQPGSYRVKLTVIEPSSGKVAEAPELVVNVSDPDAAYYGADTICVNPVGDNDFTGAPTGAQRVNTNTLYTEDALWQNNLMGNKNRWLFKRGGTYDVGVQITNTTRDGVYFGAYGTGARPILRNFNTANQGRIFDVKNQHAAAGTKSDFRVAGIEARGGFDPSSMTVSTALHPDRGRAFMTCGDPLDLVVSDCRISGFMLTTCGFNHGDVDNATQINHHFDDTYITDFGGQYVIITEANIHPKSSFSATGLAIVQNIDASSDDDQLRAPIRSNGAYFTHGRGCDLFHTSEAGQPCWKVEERPTKGTSANQDGHIINIHSSTMEGGYPGPVRINGNMSIYPRSNIQNAIFDGNIFVGNYQSECFISAEGQGLTVRNNLGVKPAAPTTGIANRLLAFVAIRNDNDAIAAGETAPIRVFNNTMLIHSTSQQHLDFVSPFTRDDPTASGLGAYPDVTQDNNLLHMYALDAAYVPFAPVTENVLFAPRCKGRRLNATFTLDTTFASVGDVLDTKPAPGSPALGAALNGLVSHLDISGDLRPAYPSIGAWEGD
ncbi:PKD domain-containing protein [uncultured Roseobacter sp.]|uniref:PKD domain-containing protein n=1 Tax=uncultured Roseobacter sp. TaxID=114847 RepID=UPI0026349679|nr:PKD domain-containing protein [uncultured Roseobacter sp.]